MIITARKACVFFYQLYCITVFIGTYSKFLIWNKASSGLRVDKMMMIMIKQCLMHVDIDKVNRLINSK